MKKIKKQKKELNKKKFVPVDYNEKIDGVIEDQAEISDNPELAEKSHLLDSSPKRQLNRQIKLSPI